MPKRHPKKTSKRSEKSNGLPTPEEINELFKRLGLDSGDTRSMLQKLAAGQLLPPSRYQVIVRLSNSSIPLAV